MLRAVTEATRDHLKFGKTDGRIPVTLMFMIAAVTVVVAVVYVKPKMERQNAPW